MNQQLLILSICRPILARLERSHSRCLARLFAHARRFRSCGSGQSLDPDQLIPAFLSIIMRQLHFCVSTTFGAAELTR